LTLSFVFLIFEHAVLRAPAGLGNSATLKCITYCILHPLLVSTRCFAALIMLVPVHHSVGCILETYIRKSTFEFLCLFTSYCIFSHLIADIRPDKTKSTYCMSYHIKTSKKIETFLHQMSKNKAENAIIKFLILSHLSTKVLRCNKVQ